MRLERLDILRWVAIVMMVIFHIQYSLQNLFGVDITFIPDFFWFYFGKISALLFISIAWISYFLAERKYWDAIYKKYFKYSWILAFFALLISIWTYFFMPSQFIVFWILHFFALSFLILPYITKLKWWTFPLAIIIIIYGVFFIKVVDSQFLFPLGFMYPWFKSADYYPFFPYFWVMLLWYSGALFPMKYNYLEKILKKKSPNSKFESGLIWSGKHALIIYIVHQPIIYIFIATVSMVFLKFTF